MPYSLAERVQQTAWVIKSSYRLQSKISLKNNQLTSEKYVVPSFEIVELCTMTCFAASPAASGNKDYDYEFIDLGE